MLEWYEVFPQELWNIIFRWRARALATTALAPAAFVFNQLRRTIEESWSNGSTAYTRVAASQAQFGVLNRGFFGPYLTALKAPIVLWENGLDEQGLVTVKLSVPDHPFTPFTEEEEEEISYRHPCNGRPLSPAENCQICQDLCEWCINLLFCEQLLRTRALWVMKKLGCNGIWPGWEDSPDYVRTLALLDNVNERNRPEYLSAEELDKHLPDLCQPQWVPKDVLIAKWQPIVAASVLLDVAMNTSLGARGTFSASNSIWENLPATFGCNQTFYAGADCHEERCFGATRPAPFVSQFLSSGGNHIPSSVRNHRVINAFGQVRYWYGGLTLPQEPVAATPVSHTWYFAEDDKDAQLPECPYSKDIPVFNPYNNNPIYKAQMTGELIQGPALFDAIAERCGARDYVACSGTCLLQDVEKGTVTWTHQDHPHRRPPKKPTQPKASDNVFNEITYVEDQMRWSLLPDSPTYRCWGRTVTEQRLAVVMQESMEELRGKQLAHWCPTWRYSSRLKQILPVIGNPAVRYIEGQLPLAMALFSTLAWEDVDPFADDLAVHFSCHALHFQAATSISGPQHLVHKLGLNTRHMSVLWDRMRAVLCPRSEIYEHVRTTGDFSRLIWDERGTCPFILEAKRSQWRFDYSLSNIDRLDEPVRKKVKFQTPARPTYVPTKRITVRKYNPSIHAVDHHSRIAYGKRMTGKSFCIYLWLWQHRIEYANIYVFI